MSIFGTSVAQSVGGAASAERIVSREKAERSERSPEARRLRPMRPDEVVVNTETADAVRNLADNLQEDAREDRQEHAGYLPTGKRASKDQASKSIDVEG